MIKNFHCFSIRKPARLHHSFDLACYLPSLISSSSVECINFEWDELIVLEGSSVDSTWYRDILAWAIWPVCVQRLWHNNLMLLSCCKKYQKTLHTNTLAVKKGETENVLFLSYLAYCISKEVFQLGSSKDFQAVHSSTSEKFQAKCLIFYIKAFCSQKDLPGSIMGVAAWEWDLWWLLSVFVDMRSESDFGHCLIERPPKGQSTSYTSTHRHLIVLTSHCSWDY